MCKLGEIVLKKLLCFIVLVPIMAMGSAYAITCQSNEFKYIDNNSNEECIENKFQITTTNDTDHFVFSMSAKGTFYIDWGDGDVEKIERANTTMTEYSHNYNTTQSYIIKFGGQATEYITVSDTGYYRRGACIFFGAPSESDSEHTGLNNTYDKLAGISGSLGALFPTTGSGGALRNNPRFMSVFRDCSNLTGSIPPNLFTGITGTVSSSAFSHVFNGCSSLTGTNIDDPDNPGMKYAIPPNLFSGVSSVSGGMFLGTFANCSGLTGTIPGSLFDIPFVSTGQSTFHTTFANCSGLTGPIPDNLFAKLNGPAGHYLFYHTFSGCSGLTGTNIDDPDNPGMKYAIPPNLFKGITKASNHQAFDATFDLCSGLTGTIPKDLFKNISGQLGRGTFEYTFKRCPGLTGPIPETLFSHISSAPAQALFFQTFSGSSGLTGPIPANLFSGISGAPADSMFYGTFYNCSGLTGTNIDDQDNTGMKYAISPTLFSGIVGAPATSMFEQTFTGCSGLTGSIPSNLFQGISGKPQPLMFSQTFRNCTGLTGLPQGLFSGISGAPASNMFNSTFNGCSSLTGFISDDFFGDITGAPANSMFYYTFQGCRNLTGPIPENLFSGIYGKAAYRAFGGVFSNCINLGKDTIGGTSKYYIPPELFAGIDKNTTATEFMTVVFNNTGLLTACPAGTSQYMTGFESYFTNRKSCTECSVNYPNYDSDTQQCYAQLSFVSDDGQTLLRSDDIYYDANYPNGYTLPAYTPTRADSTFDGFVNGAGTAIGANDVLSGNQVVYPKWSFHCDSDKWWNFKISENESTRMCLCTDKRTEHTIQFNHNGTIYHAMLTPVSEHDYTINKNTPRKLKVNMGGTIYNAYDASVLFDD